MEIHKVCIRFITIDFAILLSKVCKDRGSGKVVRAVFLGTLSRLIFSHYVYRYSTRMRKSGRVGCNCGGRVL
jgi:hypothetical protein